MPQPDAETLLIANHPALDFINTAYRKDAQPREVLSDDASVVVWLQAAGLLEKTFDGAPRGLAKLARELRAAASRLVREPGRMDPDDLALVDRIREQGRPVAVLARDPASRGLAELRRRRDDGRSSLLEPVASALAALLTQGDLRRVRTCEAHDCTLMFEDTTKSGRRRWCSMALCGNRMKVAAFRSRHRGNGA